MGEPERIQRIKSIYNGALELTGERRAVYLEQACGEDHELLREVESLLGFETQAERFIEQPAMRVAADLFAEKHSGSMIGKQLAGYRIQSLIGVGGMGEVYLARDTRLNRQVALKLLPRVFMSDTDRVRRFELESRAVSALNHPNIVTIHEIGHEQGLHFIVNEFIEGVTLRQFLSERRPGTREVLGIAAQIAAALAAAHEAGIVHRDLKPENVMLRPDGYVKVIDFGLARLSAPADRVDESLVTGTESLPGKVMGTVKYMSPEQARGLILDSRSDIFSLGIVLYEMLSGRLPFDGETSGDVVVAILDREPAPLSEMVDRLPPRLDLLIKRMLVKEVVSRCSSMTEVRNELRQILLALETEGEEQIAKQDSARSPVIKRSSILRHPMMVLVIVIVIGMLAGAGYYYRQSQRTQRIDTLAVLPFGSKGTDPDTEYLTEGLGLSLVNSLSQLGQLKVKSRSSVAAYRGQVIDPQHAGRELGVRAVLTGSVARRGDTLSVNVELVDVEDGNQLWGASYHRRVMDILPLEEEITREITGKLQVRLTADQQKQLSKRPTSNPEAYQYYLKGRYFADRLTRSSLEKGISYFNQAVKLDPEYALAYDGLAYYYIQALDLILSPREAMPMVREAASRALAIDETLAEAHFSMAMFHWQYDWNPVAADSEFRRALELRPDFVDAHGAYGFFLVMTGRTEEGLNLARRYYEMKAAFGEADLYYGPVLYFARRYDEAIEVSRQAIVMDPNFWLNHVTLGRALEQKGRIAEAVAAYEKALAIDPTIPEIVGDLGRGYALAGRKAKARELIARLRRQAQDQYVAPYNIATIQIGLGDANAAFEWLEKARVDRSWYITWLKVVPIFDSLRSDPRYAALLRSIGPWAETDPAEKKSRG